MKKIAALLLALGIGFYCLIPKGFVWYVGGPNMILTLIIASLLTLLIFLGFVGRKLLPSFAARGLYRQLGLMFVIAGFVPTVLVSVFSTYLFNFGIHAWFDRRINNVLEQSLYVANAYLKDNQDVLESVAVSIATDLGAVYNKILERPLLLSEILEAQADLHNLSEAVIFQGESRKIVVQSSLSLLLSVSEINDEDLTKAAEGKVVLIDTNPDKIEYLIKLPEYNDTYMLIAKLVDRNVVQHVDKTHGALTNYNSLRNNIYSLQVKFSLAFLLVSLLLIVIAFYAGLIIADKFVKPLARLVSATTKVKEGDLDIQVDRPRDVALEIDELIDAFNMMVKKIKYQQQDLLIAQQALAWSDVARRVAHEIKNPLTSISLSSERVLTRFSKQVVDAESFSSYMNNILKFCNTINMILTEFVNFARLPDPVCQPFDLVNLVQEVIHSRRIIHESIKYEFDNVLGKFEFLGDRAQLNQMLVNLIKNAEESLIEGNVESKRIQVSLSVQESVVILKVEDNGPGFGTMVLDRASEAYFTTRSKGTGLGLAIVKKIVQDHQGIMTIGNSSSGGGEIVLSFDTEKVKALVKKSV